MGLEISDFGAVYELVSQDTQFEFYLCRASEFFKYFTLECSFGCLAWAYPAGRQSVGFWGIKRFGVKPNAVFRAMCDYDNLAV